MGYRYKVLIDVWSEIKTAEEQISSNVPFEAQLFSKDKFFDYDWGFVVKNVFL